MADFVFQPCLIVQGLMAQGLTVRNAIGYTVAVH